jgi:hypothetical protein
MVEQGYSESEIEKKVAAERKKLESGSGAGGGNGGGWGGREDSHAVAVRKDAQMAQLAGAFGLDGDFAEGEAFDPEAQVCVCAITSDPTAAMAAKAPTTGAALLCLALPCFALLQNNHVSRCMFNSSFSATCPPLPPLSLRARVHALSA